MSTTTSWAPPSPEAPPGTEPDRSQRTARGQAPKKPVAPKKTWVRAPEPQRAWAFGLSILSAILIALVLNLVVVSQVESYTSQKNLYSQLRLSLAEGSTPVSPLTHGHLVALGTPVAVMTATNVGLGRGVVVEGSGPAQTMQGIGHRRDSVLPCQVGTSVLMARSSSYGAIGAAWAKFHNGQRFTITTGQGTCTYQVLDRRLAGDKAPKPVADGKGRVTLTTATGGPFAASGVLRIDADLVSKAFAAPVVAFPAGSLPTSEAAMGSDTSQMFELFLLLELLLAVVIATTVLWRRWGRWQTWIVATPVIATFGLLSATTVDLLLPNLL